MSESIDPELNLDLNFLPQWAKQPSNRNLYADFEGEREPRGDRARGDRPFRRREGGPSRDRQGPPSRDRQGPRPQGERRRRDDDRGRGPAGGPERRPFRDGPPPPPENLPEVRVSFHPDENGVDSLARQVRMTGRAYPLFQVAQMILAKPERHTVTLAVKKNAEGQIMQPLFVCVLDETVWMSEAEAVAYALNKHFNTFYQAEKTEIEAPKGTYTFVAQCGISGVILGPPNHHDYQNQLRKLHAERFSRMPFDMFKSRVKIVRDEEVIKKWIESQSWRTEFVCLNVPEPMRLATREEVEQHFREVHLPIIVKEVESQTMTGTASRVLRCQPLQRLVRSAWEQQKRFPLQIATVLSQQFASRGLQFFKVNKNVTYVAVARPHFLDLEATPVSEGIKRIVQFISSHPRGTRRQLVDVLAPAPAPAPAAALVPVEPAPAPAEPAPAAESAPAAGPEASATAVPPEATAAAVPPEAPVVPAGPSPEAAAIISDLHWLIHQGHVIEFADGLLEMAKKPVPRPPRPVAQAAAPAPAVAETAPEDLSSEPMPPAAAEAEEAPSPESGEAAAAPVAEENLQAPPADPAEGPVAEAEPTVGDSPVSSAPPA